MHEYQVFIGGIDHETTEQEIHTLFGQYGRIIRLKMHSNAGKSWLKNYAFITFDTEAGFRRCLNDKVNTI